jgi:hypothetical protein
MGTGWFLPSHFLPTDLIKAHPHIIVVVVIYKFVGVVTAKNPTKISISTKRNQYTTQKSIKHQQLEKKRSC